MTESSELEILNKYGFHVRPSTAFAKMANDYKSVIKVNLVGGASVDGKNIMMLMTLGALKGTKLTVSGDGEDEVEAVKALSDLINSSFGGIE